MHIYIFNSLEPVNYKYSIRKVFFSTSLTSPKCYWLEMTLELLEIFHSTPLEVLMLLLLQISLSRNDQNTDFQR